MMLAGCGGGAANPHLDGGLPHFDGFQPTNDFGPLPGQDGGTGDQHYCGQSDATECECGTAPATGYTLGASCGPGDVGSPSLCCATAAWPGATPGNVFDVECVCSQIFCEVDDTHDVCQCGFGTPSAGDTPVSSCTGYVTCCRTRSTLAPVCACFTSNIPCSDGDEQVPSCAPSDVLCDAQSPSACN